MIPDNQLARGIQSRIFQRLEAEIPLGRVGGEGPQRIRGLRGGVPLAHILCWQFFSQNFYFRFFFRQFFFLLCLFAYGCPSLPLITRCRLAASLSCARRWLWSPIRDPHVRPHSGHTRLESGIFGAGRVLHDVFLISRFFHEYACSRSEWPTMYCTLYCTPLASVRGSRTTIRFGLKAPRI